MSKELENGNIQIRQMRDGEDVITIAEYKRIDGLTPDDYKMFFDNWGPASAEINETCVRVDEVDQEEGHKKNLLSYSMKEVLLLKWSEERVDVLWK